MKPRLILLDISRLWTQGVDVEITIRRHRDGTVTVSRSDQLTDMVGIILIAPKVEDELVRRVGPVGE